MSTTDAALDQLSKNREPKSETIAADAYDKLERTVLSALRTYSNVHRGSGHFSLVTTSLFEQSRQIVLDYLGFSKKKYKVIFTTPMGADLFTGQLPDSDIYCLHSSSFGLPLGVVAMVIRRKVLKKKLTFNTGGGTARLISPEWVVWSKAPEKFEAGTPAIINIFAFAIALPLIRKYGKGIFNSDKTLPESLDIMFYRDELDHLSGKALLDELRKTLIGFNTLVPVSGGEKTFINLDNAASTPTFRPIVKAVFTCWRQREREHSFVIDEVKKICAGTFGAPPEHYDILFTSNTTEAINLAAENYMNGEMEKNSLILSSYMEHSSNDLPWRRIPGAKILRLPVNAEGFLNPRDLENILAEYNLNKQHGQQRIKLVALTGASNVLAIYNDLRMISGIVHKYNARLLIDAAQLAAHHEIDMKESDIDFLAFSAHKVYAPFGSGALICRKDSVNFSKTELKLIRKSGEENVGGIAGMGKSLVLLQRIGFDVIRSEEQKLAAKAMAGLSGIKDLSLYGLTDQNSPLFKSKGGVLLFNLKGMTAHQLSAELAARGGIGIRSGCHCSHIIVKQILGVGSYLEKFQRLIVTLFPKLELPGVARASIGMENTDEDIDRLIGTLSEISNEKSSRNKNRLFIKQEMNQFVNQISKEVFSNN